MDVLAPVRTNNKKPKERPIAAAHEDEAFASSRLSEQVRYISFSALAFVWLFLAGGKGAPVLPVVPNTNCLFMGGGIALLALILDYLQYICAYLNTRNEIKKAEEAGKDTVNFDYTDTLHCLREWMFWAKQLAMVMSVVVLLSAIIEAL